MKGVLLRYSPVFVMGLAALLGPLWSADVVSVVVAIALGGALLAHVMQRCYEEWGHGRGRGHGRYGR